MVAGPADVGRTGDAVAQVHPAAAAPADDESLEQPRAVVGSAPAGREPAAVVAQGGDIGLILLPGEVGGMVVALEDLDIV